MQSAGITYHSSNGLHRSNPLSNDKRNSTSRGRISDAMVIRSDLVDHGIANNTDLGHVLQHALDGRTDGELPHRRPELAAAS